MDGWGAARRLDCWRLFRGALVNDLIDLPEGLAVIASMTGFARATGNAGPWRLAWELKSVNAKGLDARLRLPPPFDAIEPDARARLSRKCAATAWRNSSTNSPR
jgi:hypothetical protein